MPTFDNNAKSHHNSDYKSPNQDEMEVLNKFATICKKDSAYGCLFLVIFKMLY
ncbi:MAG: hypothetical protein LKJ36_00570 [Lactobacillus sp.]|jgi:hypothetical protein|nr:hypothetical protein [Lactobacillus sp.]